MMEKTSMVFKKFNTTKGLRLTLVTSFFSSGSWGDV